MSLKAFATGLQHVGLPTKDMAQTLKFYEALGFEVAFFTRLEDKQDVNFLRLGELTIEAYESPEAAMCYGAIEHIAINVTDIEAVYRTVCDLGLNTLNDQINQLPFWNNGVKFFTIEGPNKEKIEFSQYL